MDLPEMAAMDRKERKWESTTEGTWINASGQARSHGLRSFPPSRSLAGIPTHPPFLAFCAFSCGHEPGRGTS